MRHNRFLRGWIAFLALSIIAPSIVPNAEAASKYKVLHSFGKGGDGAGVFAGLVLDSKGSLYGTTSGGGAYGYGTAFELTPSSGGRWTETVLYNFCAQPHCSDGAIPVNGMVLDAAGNLYGTAGGGVSNSGVAFELTPGLAWPDGWSFRVIYGGGSEGAFAIDKSGNLYGEWGPGKYKAGDVFELKPGSYSWTENVLHNFCSWQNCNDGVLPQFGLIWDTAGNLYGVTGYGGAHNSGVAFQLEHTASGWKEHVLHSFRASSSDGYAPYAGPIVDQAGNVYGTTLQGGGGAGCGPTGCGTVYQVSKGKDGRWTETILYNFPYYPKNGGGPSAPAMLDKAGNLYGTTSGGGDPTCSCGVVFKLTPGSGGKGKYQVLHRFTGRDGWVPQAGLVSDDKGNLYGTASEGGAYNYGVVFEITP